MEHYNILIKGGMVYDGTGSPPQPADVGIVGDRIVKVGELSGSADHVIDATGLAVAPGFINMLSWSVESLIEDGRALGTITQGVTLEVMGEGWSWGPVNEELRSDLPRLFSSSIEYEVVWNTLGEYLQFLEEKGVSTNIASFVGATTVRMNVLGYEDRAPSPAEMEEMKALVDTAMREGALGLGSSLIYPPAFYASTEELIELCKVCARYDGMYISHIRSEGVNLLDAVDEFITIVRESGVRGEIYHLKAAGRNNWDKLDLVMEKIQDARREGLQITTDMYLYTAAGTGLSSTLPPWVEEGGREKFLERIRDPELREKIKAEMLESSDRWENLYVEAGPENMMIAHVSREELKSLQGRYVSDIARERGQDPRDTILDLLSEDESRIGTIYFLMSEENLKKKISLPFMAFGSDAASICPSGIFLSTHPHPRAYGNFARLLGKYVREEKVIPLQEAVRRLTSLPASNLGLVDRGLVREGYFADIVVFDPDTIRDHATFEHPHQLSTGVSHVLVNGVLVLDEGEHTGALPGRFIRRGVTEGR